jgi:hypothetical protein
MDELAFGLPDVERQIDADIGKRVAVHKANVARLQAAREGAHALSVSVRNRPLVLLAQGDSWFDYPLTGNGLPLVDTDVIAQLRRIGPMPPTILNLAHRGDAATEEMSLPKQERLIAPTPSCSRRAATTLPATSSASSSISTMGDIRA